MTTNDRDEVISLYRTALQQFRAANKALDARIKDNSPPTPREMKALEDARQRMLELRRVLWPSWTHS